VSFIETGSTPRILPSQLQDELNIASHAGSGIQVGHWEHFSHGADVGVRGFGMTRAEAFEQAALALTAVISELETIEPREPVEMQCEASDQELLLAAWLNELIYHMATRNMLFSRFRVQVAANRLQACAWGERIDKARHAPAVEVKGATYTCLRVAEEGGEWLAQTVLDV